MIDLTPFYNTDDIRRNISAPFSDATYTYATNGHIVIRVPLRADVPASDFAPKCDRLFQQFATGDREWLQIPDLPEAIMQPCIYCDTNDPDPCIECHDTLICERPVSVEIGGSHFARKYLAMIKALPNCVIAPNGLDAAWFKFDGGDGLLMPRKWKME